MSHVRRSRVKNFLFVLLAIALVSVLTACSLRDLYGKKDDKPYGYKTAKEYADVWCGPCKEIDSFTAVEHEDGSKVVVTTLEDEEYGFTYQVEAYYTKLPSSRNPEANYLSEDFDYQYLLVFLEKTDFSKLVEKYDLELVCDPPKPANTEGLYMFYNPTIDFRTERELSDEERKEIMQFTYDSLKEFDKVRHHFTRNESCSSVFYHIYCKPSEEEAARGIKFGGESGRYGYKHVE